MLEAAYDVDKDDLRGDYKDAGFEGYKEDISRDLVSVSPYLNDGYKSVLNEIYGRKEILETMFTYGLIEHDKLGLLIQEHLQFEELDSIFEHEL